MGSYGGPHVDQFYSQFLRERGSVSPPLQLCTPMYAYIHTAHFADVFFLKARLVQLE